VKAKTVEIQVAKIQADEKAKLKQVIATSTQKALYSFSLPCFRTIHYRSDESPSP